MYRLSRLDTLYRLYRLYRLYGLYRLYRLYRLCRLYRLYRLDYAAVHNDLEDSGQGTKTWNTGPGVPKLRAFGPVHQDLAIVGPCTNA